MFGGWLRFGGRDVNIHCNNPADKADVMDFAIRGDGRSKHPLQLPHPDQQWRHIVSACMVEAGYHSPGWHVANRGVRRAHLPLPLFDSDPDLIREWWETFWRAVEIADGANLGIVHGGGPGRGCWIAVDRGA